jgi:hypothetical protein
MVCLSHRVNQDGYLYKVWAVDGIKRRVPFYRFILQAADSDDRAHVFRSDAARRSDLIARRWII